MKSLLNNIFTNNYSSPESQPMLTSTKETTMLLSFLILFFLM